MLGQGTGDMIRRCRDAGIEETVFALADGFTITIRRKPESDFAAVGGATGEVAGEVTPEVTPPVTLPVAPPVTPSVEKLLKALQARGDLGNLELREMFGLRDRAHLREHYLDPAMDHGLIERTIPDKPTSRLQKYRLTAKGRKLKESMRAQKK